MDMRPPQDTLTIDPIAMNMVNRVAAGCRLGGDLEFEGGLLVQGEIFGNIRINGRLIIWTGGVVRGTIRVQSDFYLFGQLGDPQDSGLNTHLECMGVAYVAQTGVSTGTLLAKRLQMYEGADIRGPFKTVKLGPQLPVLNNVLSENPRKTAGRRI
jgi:Polymer-forming cytoskeletal